MTGYDWTPLAKEILFRDTAPPGEYSAYKWHQDLGAGGPPDSLTMKVEELYNGDPMMPNPREHSVAAIGAAIRQVGLEHGIHVIVRATPGKAPRIFIPKTELPQLEQARAQHRGQTVAEGRAPEEGTSRSGPSVPAEQSEPKINKQRDSQGR